MLMLLCVCWMCKSGENINKCMFKQQFGEMSSQELVCVGKPTLTYCSNLYIINTVGQFELTVKLHLLHPSQYMSFLIAVWSTLTCVEMSIQCLSFLRHSMHFPYLMWSVIWPQIDAETMKSPRCGKAWWDDEMRNKNEKGDKWATAQKTDRSHFSVVKL